MKTLITILLLIAASPVFAGSATFTWNKPAPAWNGIPDPGWIINEYRIYCTNNTTAESYTRTVPGYDTETVTYNDLPAGDTACRMTSWSAASGGNGLESSFSTTVTKFISEGATPAPPTIFDFIPQLAAGTIPPGAGPAYTSRTIVTVAGSRTRVNCSFKRSARGNAVSVCKATQL